MCGRHPGVNPGRYFPPLSQRVPFVHWQSDTDQNKSNQIYFINLSRYGKREGSRSKKLLDDEQIHACYSVFLNVYIFLLILVKNDICLQLMQSMKTYLAISKDARMRSGCLVVEKAWDSRAVQSPVRQDPDSRQPLARTRQIYP